MKHMLAAILLLGFLAEAADAQLMRRPSIRATGEATVSVKPDQLMLSVGVTTIAATAQEASDQNASQVTAVITVLKRVIGSTGDIKTVGYSVNPNYKYPQGGGTPTLTGYTVTNTVQATASDLSLGGKLIDASVQAGATNIGGLRFSLKDPEPARADALRAATVQARRHAEAIAAGLGAQLSRVIAADEGGAARTVVTDVRLAGAPAGGATPTPVETGMVDVYATVTLEIEITT